jgi:signal transduction histidine kinase/DNA-binding NarL/FixJ family response regulator
LSENEQTSAIILNVDDNEATLYVRTHALQRAGYQVIEANRGSKVIPLLSTYRPDLVLLDVHLPDASGYDICRAIKTDPELKTTIVVQTSASSIDPRARLEGFQAGADAYFLEPMQPEELIANVSALLRMRRMERELTRSAVEWQKTFEAVHEGVAIVEDSGKIGRCNPAFDRLCGAPMAGKFLQDLFTVDLRTVREGTQIDSVMHGRSLCLSIDPVFDHLGQPTRFACILSDVTAERRIAALNEQLKETVDHLKRANEVADAASRAKDEFLATLSHELRTPMTSIIGWAQMLRMFGRDKDNSDEAADAILASARAQAQLVEDLLDLSRITTGKLRLRVTPLDIAEVVDAAIQTVVPAAGAKRVAIERHIASAMIIGERNRLQQVIWNLLSNAVKFTPDEGRIEVRVDVTKSRAVISVADTGRGIDPEFLPAVFDRFSQADNVVSRSAGGLGLGLAIVRSIVELHGGEVTAESGGPGKGSTFRVTLPLTKDLPAPGDALPEAMPDLHGRTILVVDDSADALKMFATFLRASGAIVFTAASVKEARAIDSAQRIDAVVTDISMPGENGLSLIRSMRAESTDRLIIGTTALGGDIREQVMASGASAVLEKPFNPADLVRLLA